MIDHYIKEFNSQEPDEQNHKQRHLINDVPLQIIYNFLMSRSLAKDRQEATRLVQNEIGLKQLQNEGAMCQEEFKKLFCKGMFKKALIDIIDKLQSEVTEKEQRPKQGDHTSMFGDTMRSLQFKIGASLKNQVLDKQTEIEKDSGAENFEKEMPLTLRIEKF